MTFDPTQPIGEVGQLLTLSMVVESSPSSCDGPAAASSIAVEVLDPHNRPVEHQVVAGFMSVLQRQALVSFTPASPGVYHLTVLFEPGLGSVQTDVQVARVAVPGAAAFSVSPDVDCQRVLVVEPGLVGCELGQPPRLDLFRGTTRVASLAQAAAGQSAVVVGGALWALAESPTGGSWLTRLVTQDDGGLRPEPGEPLSLLPVGNSLAANGAGAVVVGASHVDFVAWDGGVRLSQEHSVELGVILDNGFAVLTPGAVAEDGRVLVVGGGEHCLLKSDAGVFFPRCQVTNTNPLGTLGSALWVFGDGSLSLEAPSSSLLGSMRVPAGWSPDVDSSFLPGQQPVLRSGTSSGRYVIRPLGAELVLERWPDLGAGASLLTAVEGYAVYREAGVSPARLTFYPLTP